MELSNYKQCSNIQCVYKILNTVSKKVYIGSTINFKARLSRHVSALNRKKHHSSTLQRAFNKYGMKNFTVEVLNSDKMTLEELHAKEITYILKYNSVKTGYNQILNSKEYVKFKQSKKAINNFISARSIPVVRISLKNKKIVHYKSVSDAAKSIKEQSTNISKCCKNKLRYIKNYVFVYKKNYNPDLDYTKLRKVNYGHSPESNVQRAKSNPRSRKVYKFNTESKLIEEYYSISNCEKMNEIPKDTLKYKILKRTLVRGHLYSYNKNNI